MSAQSIISQTFEYSSLSGSSEAGQISSWWYWRKKENRMFAVIPDTRQRIMYPTCILEDVCIKYCLQTSEYLLFSRTSEARPKSSWGHLYVKEKRNKNDVCCNS